MITKPLTAMFSCLQLLSTPHPNGQQYAAAADGSSMSDFVIKEQQLSRFDFVP
jgi:hypothetical protein